MLSATGPVTNHFGWGNIKNMYCRNYFIIKKQKYTIIKKQKYT